MHKKHWNNSTNIRGIHSSGIKIEHRLTETPRRNKLPQDKTERNKLSEVTNQVEEKINSYAIIREK
jgi:hypothetical protein